MMLIIMVSLLFPMRDVTAQDHLQNICRVEDGRLIFRIDLNWTADQLRKVSGEFNLDSVLLEKIAGGKADSMLLALGWQLKRISSRTVEISRIMAPEPPVKPSPVHVDISIKPFLVDDQWLHAPGVPEPEHAEYGVNRFSREDVFSYEDSVARFFLPGYAGARQVYLSGSFNDWSTMQTPAARTENGWEVSLALAPGKYQYKFIIDGRWTADPNNNLKQDDLNGGKNSVVFCYNYRFALKGYTEVKRVYLAGSFNGFNPRELEMSRSGDGWQIPMFLRPGTHAYKFVIDGRNWITDPANPVVRPDGHGNFNSFMGIGDTTWFRIEGFTGVKNMILSGSFNGWNTAELNMEKTPSGWQLPYIMAPGNYEYKYIADGRWMIDSANPYRNGEGQYTNSFMSVKPNHVFILDNYPDAVKVIVAGSFNGWNESAYRMVRRNGRWEIPVYLKQGKHTYKFIVDGKWMLDPGNKLWEDNEYGNGNSVLWIGN